MTQPLNLAGDVANLIETVGWAQGVGVRSELRSDPTRIEITGYCIVGALPLCAKNWPGEQYRLVDLALKAECGGTIMAWNDKPGRTAGEVVSMLRRVEQKIGPTPASPG